MPMNNDRITILVDNQNEENILFIMIDCFLVTDFRNIIQTIQDHLYNTTAPSKFEWLFDDERKR